MTIDTITGILRRVCWRSKDEGNDFTIAELATGETVKGEIPEAELIMNATFCFQGTWKQEKEFRGQKQKALYFTKFTRSEPHSRIGLVHYLEKFCPGIGPTLAGRIFDQFGQNSVSKLRTSPAEVSESIRGLTLETARAAAEELKKNVKFEETRIELTQLFMGKQFSKQLPNLVLKKWGIHAASRIKRDPFCLLVAGFPSCGFARCDRMYIEQGKKLHKLKRLMLYIWHQVRESMEGHTWHNAKEIMQQLKRDASVSDEGAAAMTSADKRCLKALELGVRSGWLAIKKNKEGIFIAEGQAAENEETISRVILGLVEEPEDQQKSPMELLIEETELERLKIQEAGEFEKVEIPEWAYETPGNESPKAKNPPLSPAEIEAAEKIEIERKVSVGRKTGVCQFCGLVLKTDESIRRGYGPICGLKNYLPWGEDFDSDSDEGMSRSLLEGLSDL